MVYGHEDVVQDKFGRVELQPVRSHGIRNPGPPHELVGSVHIHDMKSSKNEQRIWTM